MLRRMIFGGLAAVAVAALATPLYAQVDPELLARTIACYEAAALSYASGGLQLDRDVEATRR